jgi:hypothetical protein
MTLLSGPLVSRWSFNFCQLLPVQTFLAFGKSLISNFEFPACAKAASAGRRNSNFRPSQAGLERTLRMRISRSLVLLSLFAASSFALEFGGGMDVGLQKAWVDRWTITTPLVGLNVPVFITDEHAVQLSLRYSPKGWKNDSADNYSAEWLNYIDIPLTYLFYPDFFPIKLGVSLGFNYSILTGASYKEPDGSEPMTDYKDYYTGNDYGLIFGVHYKRPLASGSLLFSLEYYAGLQTIRTKWDTFLGTEIRPVKNHALSLCIGYDLMKINSSEESPKAENSEKAPGGLSD